MMGKYLSLLVSLVIASGISANVYASAFQEVPFSFQSYTESQLDWTDSDDDNNSGSTALGFSVNIGGETYSYFDLDSNGYVELLKDALDSPTGYSYGSISGLIGADPSATYLLSAYDDLSSYEYGYYGYKLLSDKAVFYYDTETYEDEDEDYLNNFEMILSQNGGVRWNFNDAEYDDYGYDLFSGLYFGNTQTLLELTSNTIPEYKSYIYPVPEPASLLLLGSGLLGLAGLRKRKGSI